MHRILVNRLVNATKTSTIKLGFHTSTSNSAITRFNLPAMSPTMTEGTIHRWVVKEGDSFSAGDVLLELETDKAQIDVEAAEDGVLAKIILPEGKKSPVNTLIALLAEEGDDISNVEIPADKGEEKASPVEEKEKATESTTANKAVVSPISHHDIDTSKLKKPLSPAVLSLVTKYGIKDVSLIEPSGYGGRILKGDVLAYLGLIKPKPAPKPTLTAAPPRDQIIFAKPKVKEEEKEIKKEAPPTFISKKITVDPLFNLRQSLNEQHGTCVSVNDFIAKAAERALQDVTTRSSFDNNKKKNIIYNNVKSFSETKYNGGTFKIFNLADPVYDFISDSYTNAKPYIMQVGGSKRYSMQQAKKSENQEML
ncbi:uncharacterized protein BX663DRAFT_491460, partial [Cokeromyces recurvatus]|uniref:uncharacterized protein n=1 Tax=Cokeromyces recurvatus TaxID=90255 RepID=UPI0022204469